MARMYKFGEGNSDGLMGEYHPNPPSMENIVAQKFSKPTRMLNPFTKKFSRTALLFEFVLLFGSSGL